VFTIVIPTYNERENIVPLVRALYGLGIPDLYVLVVDDASPDGTADAVDALRGEFPGVEVLRRPGKMGLGSAYVEGFTRALEAGADVVIQMDADFSHDPADVARLIAALEATSQSDRAASQAAPLWGGIGSATSPARAHRRLRACCCA